MKFSFFILFFVLLLTAYQASAAKVDTVAIVSIQPDSLNVPQQLNEQDVGDTPVLFVLFILFILTLLFITGIVLATLTLFIMFWLITAGVLSVSLVSGLYHRSFTTGFKVFVVSFSAVSGFFSVAFIFWLVNTTYRNFSDLYAVLLGGATGLILGLGFGYLVFYVIHRIVVFFKQKLQLQ